MATGKASDFKVYEEYFQAGAYEALDQNTRGFNAASNGAIRLVATELKGNYAYDAFFDVIASAVSCRDTTSVSSADDIAMTQDEQISVKMNRKFGPIAQTIDAWKKVGKSPQEMSFLLGRMFAEHQTRDFLNTAILAAETAIQGQTALNTNKSAASTTTLTHGHLVDARIPFGDASQNIACWVMHSKPFHNLLGQAITDKIFGVANTVIYGGSPGTLGIPVVVTDAPALIDTGSSSVSTDTTYATLGLVAGGVTVTESEQRTMVSDIVTGLENLVIRIQGEYAFNVGVKGFKYNTAGGANPTDTAVGTTTNWVKVATSDKMLAGVRLVTK